MQLISRRTRRPSKGHGTPGLPGPESQEKPHPRGAPPGMGWGVQVPRGPVQVPRLGLWTVRDEVQRGRQVSLSQRNTWGNKPGGARATQGPQQGSWNPGLSLQVARNTRAAANTEASSKHLKLLSFNPSCDSRSSWVLTVVTPLDKKETEA